MLYLAGDKEESIIHYSTKLLRYAAFCKGVRAMWP